MCSRVAVQRTVFYCCSYWSFRRIGCYEYTCSGVFPRCSRNIYIYVGERRGEGIGLRALFDFMNGDGFSLRGFLLFRGEVSFLFTICVYMYAGRNRVRFHDGM